MKLTQAVALRLALPAGKADHIAFDAALPGFGLRMRDSGAKAWIAQYRVDGRTRRVTLGSPAVVPCEAARRKASEILARARLGEDPQADKVARREQAGVLCGSKVDEFLAAPRGGRPRYKAELARNLRAATAPWRSRPMASIVQEDVQDRLDEIAKRYRVASNRARSALSVFFGWAVTKKLVAQSPVIGTTKAVKEDDIARDRVLSNLELTALWFAASPDDDYGVIVRLLVLTGARRAEVGGMAWSELSLPRALWTLPKERSKNKYAHHIHLTPAAVELLEARRRHNDRDFVFGRGNGPFSGWARSKAAMDVRMRRLVEEWCAPNAPPPWKPWRLHDVRRTMATGLAQLGVARPVTERVLNHVAKKTRGDMSDIYQRYEYAPEQIDAWRRWGEHVEAIVSVAPARPV